MFRTLLKSSRRHLHQRDQARIFQAVHRGGSLLDLGLLARLQGLDSEAVAHLQLTDLGYLLLCAHLLAYPQEDAAP